MSECKCGRELRRGEKQCPACAAKKAHGWKRIAEVSFGILLTVVLFVGRLAWKVVKGLKSA